MQPVTGAAYRCPVARTPRRAADSETARRQHRQEPRPHCRRGHRGGRIRAKAAELDDEQLRKAAKLLDLDALAESADIPQFLAIAREAAERDDVAASL